MNGGRILERKGVFNNNNNKKKKKKKKKKYIENRRM
jgi:hypothetical protein